MSDEFIGKPFEMETTTVPAGKPFAIEFYAKQYMGSEIYRMPAASIGLTQRQIFDNRDWPTDVFGRLRYHHPITDRDALKAGDRVVWKGNPFDYLYNEGVIVDRDGTLWVESPSGSLMGSLAFGEDDRNCWVCGCVGNVAALAKVDFA